MLGSLAYVGGLPLEEALATTGIDGARASATSWTRIGYRRRAAVPAVRRRTPSSSCTSSRGRCSSRRRDDRRRRERAGHLVAGADDRRPVEPRRHDADARCATMPGYRGGRDRHRSSAGSAARDRRHAGRHGRRASSCIPTSINVIAARATRHRRPAQHRRGAPACRPSSGWRRSSHELARAEGVTIERHSLARFEPVAFDPDVVDLVEAHGASASAIPPAAMTSGAGHDAQMLARMCPDGDDLRAERRRHQP